MTSLRDMLIVADSGNNRILIYKDVVRKPSLTLDNNPSLGKFGMTRLNGRVVNDSLYTITKVEASVNNGGYVDVKAKDGGFNSSGEDFYFDFDPKTNGNKEEGYTVSFRAGNNNLDISETLFYFTPFRLISPSSNQTVDGSLLPAVEFEVNKQSGVIRGNIKKYQIKVNKGGITSWKTYLDDIPVDPFVTNYETTALSATYTNNASKVKVQVKDMSMRAFEEGGKRLSGKYLVKVVAVDNSGHEIETQAVDMYFNSKGLFLGDANFPLVLLGFNNMSTLNASSNNLSGVKKLYSVSGLTPTLYGIAYSGSRATLILTDLSCKQSSYLCTKALTADTSNSRFFIPVPRGTLQAGHKYMIHLSVKKDDSYAELPMFTLTVGR